MSVKANASLTWHMGIKATFIKPLFQFFQHISCFFSIKKKTFSDLTEGDVTGQDFSRIVIFLFGGQNKVDGQSKVGGNNDSSMSSCAINFPSYFD